VGFPTNNEIGMSSLILSQIADGRTESIPIREDELIVSISASDGVLDNISPKTLASIAEEYLKDSVPKLVETEWKRLADVANGRSTQSADNNLEDSARAECQEMADHIVKLAHENANLSKSDGRRPRSYIDDATVVVTPVVPDPEGTAAFDANGGKVDATVDPMLLEEASEAISSGKIMKPTTNYQLYRHHGRLSFF